MGDRPAFIEGSDTDFFSKHSNYGDWVEDGLSSDERNAIIAYTGNAFTSINDQLYGTPWDDIEDYDKNRMANIYNGLNKFELNKSVKLRRDVYSDYVFGQGIFPEDLVKFNDDFWDKNYTSDRAEYVRLRDEAMQDYVKSRLQQKGMLDGDKANYQYNGFLSFSTLKDGVFGFEQSIAIDIETGKGKGIGAFVAPISQHPSEREFLFNSNTVLQYDINSLHFNTEDGQWHISAKYVGKAKDQKF